MEQAKLLHENRLPFEDPFSPCRCAALQTSKAQPVKFTATVSGHCFRTNIFLDSRYFVNINQKSSPKRRLDINLAGCLQLPAISALRRWVSRCSKRFLVLSARTWQGSCFQESAIAWWILTQLLGNKAMLKLMIGNSKYGFYMIRYDLI